MRLVKKLFAYTIICGTAIMAAALTELCLMVYADFTPNLPNVFWILIFTPAMLFAPIAAALAISYILYRLFRWHRWVDQGERWVLLLLAGLLAPFMAVIVFFAYGFYASDPAPLPAPYPGAAAKEVWQEVGHGHYDAHVYEYTTDAPLAELEKHYQLELPQYCANEWQFSPTKIACQGYARCLVAECEIPRPLVKEPQLFTVYLRSMSETQTNVQYHIRSEGSTF